MSEVPPPRAITQITVSPGGEDGPDILYALADDGTVWRLSVALNYTWAQLPGLPTADDLVRRRPSNPV